MQKRLGAKVHSVRCEDAAVYVAHTPKVRNRRQVCLLSAKQQRLRPLTALLRKSTRGVNGSLVSLGDVYSADNKEVALTAA